MTPVEVQIIGVSLTAASLVVAVAANWLRTRIRADLADLVNRLDDRYVSQKVFEARMETIDERCAARLETRHVAG